MKFNFMNLLGGFNELPFSIEVEPNQKFDEVLKQAISMNSSGEKIFLLSIIEVTTLSANIPIPKSEYKLSVELIENKYGRSFCIAERQNNIC